MASVVSPRCGGTRPLQAWYVCAAGIKNWWDWALELCVHAWFVGVDALSCTHAPQLDLSGLTSQSPAGQPLPPRKGKHNEDDFFQIECCFLPLKKKKCLPGNLEETKTKNESNPAFTCSGETHWCERYFILKELGFSLCKWINKKAVYFLQPLLDNKPKWGLLFILPQSHQGPTLHFCWLSSPAACSHPLIYNIVIEWDETVGVAEASGIGTGPWSPGLVDTWGFCLCCVHSPFWWQHPNWLWGPTTPSLSDNMIGEEGTPYLVLRTETWPRPCQSANYIATATVIGLKIGTWSQLDQWEKQAWDLSRSYGEREVLFSVLSLTAKRCHREGRACHRIKLT